MASFASAHGKLVEIHWEDIAGYSGWHSADRPFTVQQCRTMGYLIRVKGKTITVVQDVAMEDDGKTVAQVGNAMVIPKTNVRRVRVLAKE